MSTPNLKQLLLARNDWFARQIMSRVRASPDYAYLTSAQSRLLAHMGGKPMSMAELGRQLAISRQAAHKTVNELCRRGILELRDDPQRGNSKLVVYTTLGKELNRSGARIIEDIEQQLARRMGAERLAQLKHLLSQDWPD
jgi:DNA-binding MarR family transcriptional regulator